MTLRASMLPTKNIQLYTTIQVEAKLVWPYKAQETAPKALDGF